ncbi:MAG: hypothetical protein AB1730_24710 [Myxococcota bacterium]
MIVSLIAVVLASPPLPPACELPVARDVSGLTELSKKSGALSVGLDSVATWCFDSGGTWTGGHTLKKGQPPAPEAIPSGDCAKAIGACEAAKLVLTDDLRTLLFDTLADIETPYLGVKYTPKRSGLAERPAEAADCRSRTRSELFAQAQSRMDIARLANQAQSEYRNYRTWLYKQGLACAQLVARGEKDPTRRGIAIDAPVQKGGGHMQVDGAGGTAGSGGATGAGGIAGAGGTVGAGGVVGESGATGAGSARGVGGTTGAAGTSGVGGVAGASGTTGSGAVAGASEATGRDGASGATGAGGAAGSAGTTGVVEGAGAVAGAGGSPVASVSKDLPIGGPTQERQKALASSMLVKWRYLAEQRALIEPDPDWATAFLMSRELRDCRCQRVNPKEIVLRLESGDRVAALQADDDKNTKCELCLQDAYPPWKARVQRQCAQMDEFTDFELGVLQRSDDGNGLPQRCFDASRARRASKAGTSPVGTAVATTTTGRGGATFIITKSPDPTPTTPVASGGGSESPSEPAPVPPREDGRVYYRLFMSRTCVADVEPGPIQARTGDLMPVPPGAAALVVRSPCGGMVEIYFGREPKPRVTEVFGKNEPLRLQFRKP